MDYINTLKCELVDTNAYKLWPSLSENVVVGEHGCHKPYILVSKLKKTKTDFLRCTGYANSIKTYKARFIANSSFCTTTELSKLLTSCLTAVKDMLSSTMKRYMRDPLKIYLGLLKIIQSFTSKIKKMMEKIVPSIQLIYRSKLIATDISSHLPVEMRK